MADFKGLVTEGRKDTVFETIKTLIRRISAQFEPMKTADTDVVLKSVKDASCLMLRQSLKMGHVIKTDPDGDIPMCREVLSMLPLEKKLSRPAVEHIISLMDDVSAAHGYMSTALAHLSSLGKLIDPETFHPVLCACIRPIVQLNILERYLELLKDSDADTSWDAMTKKLAKDLLPRVDTVALMREPDNRPTRLLCTVLWLKLSHLFLNQGTQRQVGEIFDVQAKWLSKLLTG